MNKFVEIMTGLFFLVVISLFLVRGRETIGIIQAWGDFFTQGVQALHGR